MSIPQSLTSASYQELKRFLRYYRHYGTPTIIGGWAVYLYNPYYGSIDIGVVGPSYRGELDSVISGFEHSFGYVKKEAGMAFNGIPTNMGLDVALCKRIDDGHGNWIDMEIDACGFENKGARKFHEDHNS